MSALAALPESAHRNALEVALEARQPNDILAATNAAGMTLDYASKAVAALGSALMYGPTTLYPRGTAQAGKVYASMALDWLTHSGVSAETMATLTATNPYKDAAQ
jgi:hypothetical protein